MRLDRVEGGPRRALRHGACDQRVAAKAQQIAGEEQTVGERLDLSVSIDVVRAGGRDRWHAEAGQGRAGKIRRRCDHRVAGVIDRVLAVCGQTGIGDLIDGRILDRAGRLEQEIVGDDVVRRDEPQISEALRRHQELYAWRQ